MSKSGGRGNLCLDVTVTATLKRDSIEGGADEPGIKKASKITHSLFIDFQCFQRHFLYTGYLSKIRGVKRISTFVENKMVIFFRLPKVRM